MITKKEQDELLDRIANVRDSLDCDNAHFQEAYNISKPEALKNQFQGLFDFIHNMRPSDEVKK